MKITQEKVTVMLEVVSGYRRKKGVQKYHISHKGTARLNPEYERIKNVASVIEKPETCLKTKHGRRNTTRNITKLTFSGLESKHGLGNI